MVDLHHVAPGVVPVACLRAAVQAVAGGGLRARGAGVAPLRAGPHLNFLISFKQE
jgi:hypothetical protein